MLIFALCSCYVLLCVAMCCYDIVIKVVSKETNIKGFW